jgi:hypothetical protein
MSLLRGLPTAVRPGDARRGDCLIGDADDPVLAEFIRGELLLGTIRTAPAGRGRILIVPSDAWFSGRSQTRP